MAIEWESTKVTTWRKGETIVGDDFIAQTEAVADYLAALRHPVAQFERIQFNCQVKARVISPSVTQSGTNPPQYNYVQIVSIYDIKDCVEIVE